MVRKSKRNVMVKVRKSLNRSSNLPTELYKQVLMDNSWPSSRSIRVSSDMLHLLASSSKHPRQHQLLQDNLSTRSITMSPRTHYLLDKTFRAPPVRRSDAPVHVDVSSELGGSILSPEVPQSAFKYKLRARDAHRKDTEAFESALVSKDASKSKTPETMAISLEESPGDFNSPVLSQPLQWRKRTRNKKPSDSSAFKEALQDNSSITSKLSDSLVHVDANSELSGRILSPEVPQSAFKRKLRARDASRIDTKAFESALVSKDASKSKPPETLAISLEESPGDFNSPVLSQPLQWRKRTRNKKPSDSSAFKEALQDNSSITSKLSRNSSKHNESASMEEPESPQARPRFDHKKRVAATRPGFKNVLESTMSTKSRLATNLSSEEEEEEENIPIQRFQRKRKLKQIEPSEFNKVLNDSGSSQQNLEMSSNKHQDNISIEEEPESPQSKPRFHRKKRVNTIAPEFEKALETLDSTISTKSRLARDLSSRENGREENISVQLLQKRRKLSDPFTLGNVLNDSEKSLQNSRRNSSKHHESISDDSKPDSPQEVKYHFRRKKQVATTAQEFEKALESTISTKSHLADLSSKESSKEENISVPVQHLQKKKRNLSDLSTVGNVLNDFQKSLQNLKRNSSKHQESTSDDEKPHSPEERPRFGRKKQVATTVQEFENVLESTMSTKSRLATNLSSEEEEEEENIPIQRFQRKRKLKQIEPSEFNKVLNDSGSSQQNLEMSSNKHQDNISIEEEPESPQSKPRFHRKKRVNTIAPEFEKALETLDSTISTKSRLARDLSSRENGREENISVQLLQKRRKLSDPFTLGNVLNDSEKSLQNSRRNSSKHLESISDDGKPDSPQVKYHFRRKKQVATTAQEFEKAFESMVSTKSDLAANLSSKESDREENASVPVQNLQKRRKLSDPSTLGSVLNDSEKSLQYLRRNSSKHQESTSDGGKPDSPQVESHFRRKKQVATTIQESQVSLENAVSTRSSVEDEKEEGKNIPLSIQHFKKRKSKQVDPSAFSDVFTDSGESLQHSEVVAAGSPSVRVAFQHQHKHTKTANPQEFEAAFNTSESLSKSSTKEITHQSINIPTSPLTRSVTRKNKMVKHVSELKNSSINMKRSKERNGSTERMTGEIFTSSSHNTKAFKINTKKSLNAERFNEAFSDTSDIVPESINSQQNSPVHHFTALASTDEDDDKKFASVANDSAISTGTKISFVTQMSTQSKGKHKRNLKILSELPHTVSPDKKESVKHPSEINHSATGKSVPTSLKKKSVLQKRLSDISVSPSRLTRSLTQKSQSNEINNSGTTKLLSAFLGKKSSIQERFSDISNKSTHSTMQKNQSSNSKKELSNSNHSIVRKSASLLQTKESAVQEKEKVSDTLLSPSRITHSSMQKNLSLNPSKETDMSGSKANFSAMHESVLSVKKQLSFGDVQENEPHSASKIASESPSSSMSSPYRQQKKINFRHKTKIVDPKMFTAAFEDKSDASSHESTSHDMDRYKHSEAKSKSFTARENSVLSNLSGQLENLPVRNSEKTLGMENDLSAVVSKTAPGTSSSRTHSRFSNVFENSAQLPAAKSVNSRSSQNSNKIENTKHFTGKNVKYKQPTLESIFSMQREELAPYGTQERRLQLGAVVKEVKTKFMDELEMKNKVAVVKSLPQFMQLPKMIPKKPVIRRLVNQFRMVNGKVYSSRLKKPQPWATPRLYSLLIEKCREKFGELKARKRAEEFMIYLCKQVGIVKRRKKIENYKHISDEVKMALYKLGIIKSLMDYFIFIEKYLPFHYRTKVIECQRAYGVVTGIPIPLGTDLFADLNP